MAYHTGLAATVTSRAFRAGYKIPRVLRDNQNLCPATISDTSMSSKPPPTRPVSSPAPPTGGGLKGQSLRGFGRRRQLDLDAAYGCGAKLLIANLIVAH